jgi:hypothetical protein
MAGHGDDADVLYYVIQAIKGWDKGYDSLAFKNTDRIVDMSEVEGNSLHDYIEYALEYVKLVRNVLKYYVSKNLIDDVGNITNYSNDNEIVQITIVHRKRYKGLVDRDFSCEDFVHLIE